MAFISAENTVQVEMRYIQDLQEVENVLYFRNDNGVTTANLIALLDYLFDWYDDFIRPLQATTVLLREIYGFDLTTQTGTSYTRVSSPPVAGGDAGPALPNNVTIAIWFRGIPRGRSYRGRNYFIGLTEGDVTNNTISSLKSTPIQDAYTNLRDGVDVTGYQWVVVSRYSGNLPRPNAVVTPVASLGFANFTVDSQRRRLPGRGR